MPTHESSSGATERLQHVVLMRFPDVLGAADDAEVRRLVAALHPAIEELLECRFDSDLTGARSGGFHYLLYTELADTAALSAYIAHPIHQELVRWLDTHDCERVAFDYYIDASEDATA